MKINNVKNVSGLITFVSENTAWSPVTSSNVVNTLGYRKNGSLESLKKLSQNLTDCAKYGADCGFSGFIYYNDTIKFEGDLKSMMDSKVAKRTKNDTMRNENNHRNQMPPLP